MDKYIQILNAQGVCSTRAPCAGLSPLNTRWTDRAFYYVSRLVYSCVVAAATRHQWN